MTLKNTIVCANLLNRLGRPVVLQVLAQITYIYFSLPLFVQERSALIFFACYLLPVCAFFLERRLVRYRQVTLFSWLTICNSTILNAVTNPNILWAQSGLVSLAFLSKVFFRSSGRRRPLLNPSAAAIFLVAMLQPSCAAVGVGLWAFSWPHLAAVVAIGLVVSCLAKTVLVSLGYILGYVGGSFVMSAIIHTFFRSSIFSMATIGLQGAAWLAPFCTIGYMIFIFHVVTDPQSAPTIPREKAIFGLALGLGDIALKSFFFGSSALIAYVLVSLIFNAVIMERRARKLNPGLQRPLLENASGAVS